MKKTILFFIILLSVKIFAQTKVSALPDAAGLGNNSLIAIVENGVSKKLNTDVLLSPLGKRIDSLRGIISTKPLYRDVISNNNIAIWNYDSSSTANLVHQGNTALNITGTIPIGSTGVLLFNQGYPNNETLTYNGTSIPIGNTSGKTSVVGFIKLANSYVFSVDTTSFTIAQSGGYDASSQALFTAAGINATYKTAVDNAIKGLKAITLTAGGTAWSKSTMINGRAGTSLAQQSYNWKDPSLYQYTYLGTFSYNANGTQFSGTNYINTGITPSTAFTGTTSDISIVNVIGTVPTTGGIFIGALNGSVNFYEGVTSTTMDAAIGFGDFSLTTSPITARYIFSYLNGTTFNSYKNGSLLDSRTVSNNPTFASIPVFEGGVNENGTVNYLPNVRIDVTQIINSKLTPSEAAAIDGVWATYQSTLGR